VDVVVVRSSRWLVEVTTEKKKVERSGLGRKTELEIPHNLEEVPSTKLI
jgi:hypothetical protein